MDEIFLGGGVGALFLWGEAYYWNFLCFRGGIITTACFGKNVSHTHLTNAL